MNEIVEKEKTNAVSIANKEQSILLPIAEKYIKMFPEIGEDKTFNAKQAVISMALKMSETTDKAGRKAVDVCTNESIMQVAQEVLVKKLDLMKNQASLIVRGTKLMLQAQYQGNVRRALDLHPELDHFNFVPIYKDDEINIEVLEDGKIDIVSHKTSFNNISNDKLVGGYVRAIKKDGSVFMTEVMTMEQIRIAWSKSSNPSQSVHKEFPVKMARKTILNSICSWLINTTGEVEETQEIEEQESKDENESMNINIDTTQNYSEPIIEVEETTSSPKDDDNDEDWTEEDISQVMDEIEEEEKSKENLKCSKCGAKITEKVANYSIDNFGSPLCYKCQKEQ